MSQVRIESRKQKRRARQRRHNKLHPKFPARSRRVNPVEPEAATPSRRAIPETVRPTTPSQIVTLPIPAPAAKTDAETTGNLTLPIEELEFPVRTYNVLKREGVNTLGELIGNTEKDLLDMRGMGQRSIDQYIKPRLAGMGLSLKVA